MRPLRDNNHGDDLWKLLVNGQVGEKLETIDTLRSFLISVGHPHHDHNLPLSSICVCVYVSVCVSILHKASDIKLI